MGFRKPSLALLSAFFAANTLAQTSTSCNPTDKTCPADTALSTSTYTHDFTTGADDAAWNVTAGSIKYTSAGAEFIINKKGDAPTIQSKWYIFFGSVSFHIKSASGTGIVSSAILESDDLDEVDWEWLGGNDGAVQSNYFGKGNTTTHDREKDLTVSTVQSTSHNYTIEWTSSSTNWIIDGTTVRTLAFADANGAAGTGSNYPQTPMNIRIGIWAGGDPDNAAGTIEWAGGETDYTKAPFTMTLEKVEVVNYNPAGTYTYGDQTGDFGSIKLGDVSSSSSSASSSSSSDSPSTSASVSVAAVAAESAGVTSAASATVSASVTTTATGMWWTTSAEAMSAKATENGAPGVRRGSAVLVALGAMIVACML